MSVRGSLSFCTVATVLFFNKRKKISAMFINTSVFRKAKHSAKLLRMFLDREISEREREMEERRVGGKYMTPC